MATSLLLVIVCGLLMFLFVYTSSVTILRDYKEVVKGRKEDEEKEED
jgi:uncharacterized membrane protein